MMLRLAVALAMGLAAAAFPARAQVVEHAGDWLLVCDNEADCTVIGAPSPDVLPGDPRVELRLYRGHEAAAALLLSTYSETRQGDRAGPGLTLDGLSLSKTPHGAPLFTLRVDPRTTGIPGHDYFTPEDSAQIVDVLASDQPSYLRSGFGAFAALPVGNLARLLRRMDRVQAAAREAAGEGEDEFTSASHAYDLFPREQVADRVDHPLFHQRCRGAPLMHARGYALDHTTVPTLLVHLTCGGRDYLYIWYPVGSAPPAPLALERPRQRGANVMSASFNPDEGTLTLVDHPPHRTDCGVRTLWGWVDGEGMVLLETSIMPRCRGIAPGRWPQSYAGPSWRVW